MMPKKTYILIFLLCFLAYPFAVRAGMAGKPAPDFTLITVDGSALSLGEQRGKVVFIDFWASWCPPCKKEFPEIIRLLKNLPDTDFVVLAVNVDKKRAHAEDFLSTLQGGLPERLHVLLDPGATVIPQYNALAMPTSFIIDRAGAVRYIHYGFNESDPEKWASEVEGLLSEGAGR